jgi:hypothetical protein
MSKSSHGGKFFNEYLAFCRTKGLRHFSPESFYAWDESLTAEGFTQKQIEDRITYVRQERERRLGPKEPPRAQ